MNIKIYKKDGNLDSIEGLTNENLKKIMGMLCKVLLKNGDMQEGYIDPLRTKGDSGEFDGTVHDYIYLWTFNNLDEENQKYDIKDGYNITKINITDIEDIYAILYSNPRWGGRLTNKFFIDIKE